MLILQIQSCLDHQIINNQIMSQTDVIFQSFGGAGSIYISGAPLLTFDQFQQRNCRAMMTINIQKKLKGEIAPLSQLRQISIDNIDRVHTRLDPHFHTASLFISEARKTTNIMVWCPNDRQLAAVFAFAHLVLKYGYSIDYIWRLYQNRITHVPISQAFLYKLRNLTKKPSMEEEAANKLKVSTLGKRLLRINNNYSELAKDSHRDWKYERKTQYSLGSNPEKSSRRELSESDLIVDAYESEQSVKVRERSSTGSQIKTRRNVFKSYDFDNCHF